MNKAKIITALIALLAALGLGGYTIVKKTELGKPVAQNKDVYRVFQIIDGDTFRIENAEGERVRLLGLNAPEEGECYAKEAGGPA